MKIRKGSFLADVLTVLSGNVVAQAITLAGTLIVGRLYTAEAFGVFSVYDSLLSILGVIVCLRYELAIVKTPSESEGAQLFHLSVIVSFVVALLTLLIVLFAGEKVASLLGSPKLEPWLWVVPIGIFFTGTSLALSNWATRKKAFGVYSASQVGQSGTTVVFQTLTGLFTALGPGGLILGRMLGRVVNTAWIFVGVFRKENKPETISAPAVKSAAKNHRRFPLYLTWPAFINSVAMQMPILIFARFLGDEVTGQFGMSFKALNFPVALIAASLAQVLYQKLAEKTHKNQLKEALSESLKKLSLVSIPLFVVCASSIYWLPFALGDGWELAAQFGPMLAIIVTVRFVVSSVSRVLILTDKQSWNAAWQVLYFAVTGATLYFGAQSGDAIHTIRLLVINDVVLYAIYLVLILKSVRVQSGASSTR